MKIRVIIAGSRDFADYSFLENVLDDFFSEHIHNEDDEIAIVSGGARGADELGIRYAKEKYIPLKVFRADWNTHGRSAGYIRNGTMLNYITEPDCKGYVIAFWDGKSKGTAHMIKIAKKANIDVIVKIILKKLE